VDGAPSPEAPRTRAEDLIRRTVGDETIVYDRATHRAHCLNDLARFVLDRCDGDTPPPEIARAVQDRFATDPNDATTCAEAALSELAEAGLIEGLPPADSPGAGAVRDRRATLRAVGLAFLAPLVVSLTAPTPAEAQTCRDRPCTSSRQCCPEAPCCRAQGQNPPRCRPGSLGNPNCLP
jgi:PqqD family protein of HPr-rel-A system